MASKLLAANPEPSRVDLPVGDVLGLKAGDNPHQWYSPISVHRFIDQISADYKLADPRQRLLFVHCGSGLRCRLRALQKRGRTLAWASVFSPEIQSFVVGTRKGRAFGPPVVPARRYFQLARVS
jgi:hypothetical protein